MRSAASDGTLLPVGRTKVKKPWEPLLRRCNDQAMISNGKVFPPPVYISMITAAIFNLCLS